ncbi:MAG: sugar transferase [Chloroflexi bacterium]|nr:sugar transferase [Chloroflexota bacterium]
MSLVGPRPKKPASWPVTTIGNGGGSVRPGITGPMQINGRGALPFNDRVRLELAYIEHYSLLTDCQILLQTIPAVIKGHGAW